MSELIREDDLATEVSTPVEELRKWRRANLVVDEHYQKNPVRYTPEGRKRVLEAFGASEGHSDETVEQLRIAREIMQDRKEALAQLSDDDIETVGLVELLEAAEPEKTTVRPIVEFLPPNWRLVMCQVGPHHRVRVMVRPNNKNYIPKMEIPLDVSLINFNPNELLIYNGDPPRRKGMW
jgi:hypothetical protein